MSWTVYENQTCAYLYFESAPPQWPRGGRLRVTHHLDTRTRPACSLKSKIHHRDLTSRLQTLLDLLPRWRRRHPARVQVALHQWAQRELRTVSQLPHTNWFLLNTVRRRESCERHSAGETRVLRTKFDSRRKKRPFSPYGKDRLKDEKEKEQEEEKGEK